MTDIFTIWRIPYHIRNIGLVGSENSRSIRFDVDVTKSILINKRFFITTNFQIKNKIMKLWRLQV